MAKIFVSAGEASGDLYGANLIADLKKIKKSNLKIFGMGGVNMQKGNISLVVDAKDLAIVGLVDVILNWRKIYKAWRKIKICLLKEKPDLVILIDYPGFNLRLARLAKKLGAKTLYYISPQIWAWHYNRIKIIKKYVDHMAVILPFEKKIYQDAKIPVSFVGHPLLKLVKPILTQEKARKHFGIKGKKVIGLMPGSRQSEIKYLLPVIIGAVKKIRNLHPDAEFLLPLASTLTIKDLEKNGYRKSLPIKIIKSHTYDFMNICDAIIVASGTATLEVAITNTPMTIIYKTASLNYFIGKQLIKIPFIGLPNLIAKKNIIPELIQDEANPENISHIIHKILTNTNYRNTMKKNLHTVKAMLQEKNHKNLTKIALNFLK